MEIYDAEAHLKKLFTYVEELADSRPYMYKKSKDRLRAIADTCNQVVHLISTILQDETFTQEDAEFEQTSNSEILAFISSMESELTKLKQFSGAQDVAAALPEAESKNKLSSTQRKQAMKSYLEVLKLLPNRCNIDKGKECAKLIQSWFETRFIDTISIHPGFRYNIRRVPRWILCIVVAYSKHVEEGDESNFLSEFYSWIADVKSPDSDNNFSVPYEIYQLDREITANDLTLTSVIIWDILMNSGLLRLTNLYPIELSLSEDAVYDLCKQLSPQTLDKYVNYISDKSILRKCNMTEVM